MHEVARHGIHITEVLEASVQTLEAIKLCQENVYDKLKTKFEPTYLHQAKEYTDFQVQSFKNLKLRSGSNDKRLQNEINLVYPLILNAVFLGKLTDYCRVSTLLLVRTIWL